MNQGQSWNPFLWRAGFVRNKSETASTSLPCNTCFYVCPASLISSFSLFQHSPWKYFPLSQPVLRGTLRNVAGEDGWEGLAWSEVVKTLRLIFPSWLQIAYLLIAYGGQGRRAEGKGWGLLKHGVVSVNSVWRGSAERLHFWPFKYVCIFHKVNYAILQMNVFTRITFTSNILAVIKTYAYTCIFHHKHWFDLIQVSIYFECDSTSRAQFE